MKITKENLVAWGACFEGVEFFEAHFPTGEADYQDALDALAKEDLASYALWLLKKAGADTTKKLELDELVVEGSFFFSGLISVKGSIKISKCLFSGNSIEAGDGYGIFAGIRIRLSDWSIRAIVSAKSKPINLMTGYYKEKLNEI